MTTTTDTAPPPATATALNDLWYDTGNGNLRSQCVGVMTWQPAGGVTGWTGAHASLIASPQSPYLLLVTADGTGVSGWSVTSPSIAAAAGDTACASCPVLVPSPFDVPVNLAAVYVGVAWLDSSSAVISVTQSTAAVVDAGATATLTVTATGAPAGTVAACVVVGDGEDSAAGTQLFAGPAALAVWSPFAVGTNAIADAAVTPPQVASNAIQAGAVATGAIDGQAINAVTINGSTITAADIIVSGSQGGLFVYSSGGTVTQTLSGSGSWLCPAGVTTVKAECWGGGAGGSAGSGASSPGGGGGEYAAEPSLAVTPGDSYAYAVGAAGTGGTSGNGGNGGGSTFAGDSVTVTAHGGSGLSPGGSGSTNTVHFSGGFGSSSAGPGGGGGSGGTSSAGNPGAGAAGAAAVTGGGPGGNGGTGSGNGLPPSTGPGGGGGAGGGFSIGGAGFHGKVRLTYTSASPALIGSIAGVAGTSDPVAGVAYPEGVASDHVTLTTVTAVPATPSLGCVLYYKSGALWALGPSGTPVSIATT